MAWWPSGQGAWLGDQQTGAGSNPGRCAVECNPGQVVYTHVPNSMSADEH